MKAKSKVKNTKQIYCYLKPTHYRYLVRTAKRLEVSQSKLLNYLLNEAEIRKLV